MKENSLTAETTFKVETRGIYINLPDFTKQHLLKSYFDLIAPLGPNVIMTHLIYQGLPVSSTGAALKYKLPRRHYLFKHYNPLEIVFTRARRDGQFVWGDVKPLVLTAPNDASKHWLKKIERKFRRWLKRNEQANPVTSSGHEPMLCHANLNYRHALAEICYECLEAYPFSTIAFDLSGFSQSDLETMETLCYCSACMERLKSELDIDIKSARKGLSSENQEKWQKWLIEEFVSFFSYLRARWQCARYTLIFSLIIDKQQLTNDNSSVLPTLIKSRIFDEVIIKGLGLSQSEDIAKELKHTLQVLPDDLLPLPLFSPRSSEEWISQVKAARHFPVAGAIISPQFATNAQEIGNIKSEIYSELAIPPEHNVLESICELLKLIIGDAQQLPATAAFFRNVQKSFTPEECLIPVQKLEPLMKDIKEMEDKAALYKDQHSDLRMLPRNINLLLKLFNLLSFEETTNILS